LIITLITKLTLESNSIIWLSFYGEKFQDGRQMTRKLRNLFYDWPLRIKTAEDMLPYMFAPHKYNFAQRFWTGSALESNHCTRLLESTNYNGQWCDMFIETNWMRKGHVPGGIIGTAERPQTTATWVFSMDATMTMTGDLKKMSGSEEVVQMTHKEETPSRINQDGDDRQSLCRRLLSCISTMDPDTHVTGSLLNIRSGHVAQPNVSVTPISKVLAEKMIQCEKSWP